MNEEGAAEAMLRGAAGVVLIFAGFCLVASAPVVLVRAALSRGPK